MKSHLLSRPRPLQNVDKVVQQKELQVQVATTHLQRAQTQLQQERQQFLREKQAVLQQVADSQRQACEQAAREAHLRQELCLYTSKYEEFQGALSQSNQVFRSFKADMDKVGLRPPPFSCLVTRRCRPLGGFGTRRFPNVFVPEV